MNIDVPSGTRPGARVILFGPSGRVLLLHATLATRRDFWVCPGGGVEQGETWEQAAHREVREETGLTVQLDRMVWFRRHAYTDGGRDYDLFECYFVGHAMSEAVLPTHGDSYVTGHRWWTIDELETSDAAFAPRKFSVLVEPLSRGELPEQPFDCGV